MLPPKSQRKLPALTPVNCSSARNRHPLRSVFEHRHQNSALYKSRNGRHSSLILTLGIAPFSLEWSNSSRWQRRLIQCSMTQLHTPRTKLTLATRRQSDLRKIDT